MTGEGLPAEPSRSGAKAEPTRAFGIRRLRRWGWPITAVAGALLFVSWLVQSSAIRPQPAEAQAQEPPGPSAQPPGDPYRLTPEPPERIPGPPEPRPLPPPRLSAQNQAQPAAPAQRSQEAPQQPPLSQAEAELVLTLIRSTITAVHHANETENYTVLRDLGAPGFREANSATKLATIFAPIRELGVDLSAVTYLDPQLSRATLTQDGMLYIAGALATRPAPVDFELLFQPVNDVWRLFGISIRPVQPQTGAPAGEAADGAGASPDEGN